MAFQAQAADIGANEHFGIVGTVRLVAGLAVTDLQGGMFEDEGAAFFGVAFEAGGLGGGGSARLVLVEAAMRLVAVDAAHGVFGHPVVEGAREIGAALGMAAEAESVGGLLEEAGGTRAGMDAVAVGAGEAGFGMLAAGEAGEFMIFIMAGEALLAVGLGGGAFEGDDFGFIAAVGGMVLAGAMTFFAGVFEVELGALLQDGMGIFIEAAGQVFVTHGAVFLGDAAGFGSRPLFGGILGQQAIGITGQEPPEGGYHSEREQVVEGSLKRHGNLDQ